MSFCPKNRLLFCCEFLQLLFQAANVPHPFLATGNGRAHKSLKHTNRDLEAVLASGSMTKCEPTWYDHHVKFWDVFGSNQNRNRQNWKAPSSLLAPSCNDEVIVDVPRIQTLHRFIELTPQCRFNCPWAGASQSQRFAQVHDSNVPRLWRSQPLGVLISLTLVSQIWMFFFGISIQSTLHIFFQTIESQSTCYFHLFPLEIFFMSVIQPLNIWMTKPQPHPLALMVGTFLSSPLPDMQGNGSCTSPDVFGFEPWALKT